MEQRNNYSAPTISFNDERTKDLIDTLITALKNARDFTPQRDMDNLIIAIDGIQPGNVSEESVMNLKTRLFSVAVGQILARQSTEEALQEIHEKYGIE